jgi:hypothetical protein
MDDAQWIQLMKKMETVYGKDKLEGRYPVWWNQVVK